MRFYFTAALLIFSQYLFAQKIYGTVYDDKGDLLPYASITIKGTTIGASANDKAKFSFSLPAGNYTVVCQHIGYAASEKKITLTDEEELTFILSEQKFTMKEVIIKPNQEDPAYQIIRNAIKKRTYFEKQVNAFSCNLYGKDLIKLRSLPKKILGKKIPDEDRKQLHLDSSGQGIIYLSESVSKINMQLPDKFKMEVVSSRVSGSGGFGFTFPAFISLYSNNVTVFTESINPRGFVSPIADGAIGFYKFKYLGSFYEDGKEINSVRVTPRRTYEPLFSGIINIEEGEWRIHSFNLMLTKSSQLEMIDSLQISQLYVPVSNVVWRVKNQLLHFNFKQLGIDAIGNFLSVYSNYNIAPAFSKSFFDRVIIKYDTAVNKHSKTYWDTIRPVPLEKEEQKDYQVKDSIYQVQKDSALSKSAIDSLKKKQGAIKPQQVFWNGIRRTHYSKTNRFTWGIEPLIPNLEYNAAEGLVLNANGYFYKYIKKLKSNISFNPHLRYGFSNTHFNAWAGLTLKTRDVDTDKKLKRQSWYISGGKRVSEFNKESSLDPLIDGISILLYGRNYIKTYENYFGNIGFNKSYESGVRFYVNALYENRIPMNNTTHFTFFKSDSGKITPNYPNERIAAQFTPHKAVVFYAGISFKPGQRYIQFPYSKVPIGSKFPLFSFDYEKGVKNIFGSSTDFDKWKFTISDDKNFKLAGLLKYKIGVGGFLKNKSVFIQDYEHFNGNQTLSASEYVNSFQLANYYQYSTTASFYSVGFLEHHFNGLLTNKIPLFKKLNWNLVAGGNGLFINNKSNYAELFAGLENILKIFRVDAVVSFENGKQAHTGIRIGAGGILGSNIKVGKRGSSASLQF